MRTSACWQYFKRRPQVVVIGLLAVAAGGAVAWQAWAHTPPSPEMIAEGKVLFTHEWQPGDPLSAEGDGLGPVFNAKSCVACHFQGGTGGSGPNSANVTSFEIHPIQSRPDVHTGSVRAAAVDEQHQETRDCVADVFPIVPAGQRDIGNGCIVTVPAFNPVEFQSINTPALFGLGELNRISDSAITRNRWSRSVGSIGSELNGDFAATPAGKVRKVNGDVGKFGWKGQFASVEQFVATACAVEMGLSNPLMKQQTPGRFTEDPAARLDLNEQQFRALVAYVETLPRPEQVLPASAGQLTRVRHGEELFGSVGCADCHTPELDGVAGVYSDFLIYSLEESPDDLPGYGPRNPDPIPWPEDTPQPQEWQTPPLWGVADSAPYFHDGKSPTLESAIERHGGAARGVRDRYRRLSRRDQADLVAFLRSLRAPQTRK